MFFKKWETKGEKNRGISLEFSFIKSSGEKDNSAWNRTSGMSFEIICHLGKLRTALQQSYQAGPVCLFFENQNTLIKLISEFMDCNDYFYSLEITIISPFVPHLRLNLIVKEMYPQSVLTSFKLWFDLLLTLINPLPALFICILHQLFTTTWCSHFSSTW
ncbi:unnamed protein product [Brugia pahangi]|uniref:UDENN domain-containing protein n=1 Tax=Brugia pahangi TaxID=6280 RepID=A0A0N4TVG7_BRUPA|nr:unnamed protein product [Brugia pahangi]